MSTTTSKTPVLGRFELPAGRRKIITKTVKGTAQLLDVPQSGAGPKYLIEGDLTDFAPGEAQDIADVYIRHAEKLGRSPMPSPLPEKGSSAAKAQTRKKFVQMLSRDLMTD